MRNNLFMCVVLNICSISLIVALYIFYKSIISTQNDIRRDIDSLSKEIVSIEELIKQEIVFDIVDEKKQESFDIENCCDFSLTSGMPMYTGKNE